MDMNIVKAPTDPEKARSFFYIIKDMEIFGQKDGEGRGVTYLYQDGGRLVSSAEITGNVKDEKILSLLKTVEGFRELVHSIGISVEMEDKNGEAEFVFQMYGREDQYGGGTNIIASVPTNSAEKRIYLKDIDWKKDDYVPGQIHIHMEKPEEKAVLSVRLYLMDGYEAPVQEDERPVDTGSDEYRKMIERSLVQIGNTKRLSKVIAKAKSGGDVTIAYIGGSITQGAGATPINTECYAYKSFCGFKSLLGGGDNLHYIKAGVGGTPSELGVIRFERDVLRDGEVSPDLIIVEFAVNDDGDELKGGCYESLVRKILSLPSEPAVILLFSVFADDYNLQERLIPVGIRYDLAMCSVKNAVLPGFYDRENKVLTKHQYFYDMYHPTNLGHTIMADCLINVMEKTMLMEKFDEEYDPCFQKPPCIGAEFENVVLLDRKDNTGLAVISQGGFTLIDKELQSVEMDMDLDQTPEFIYNWMYDGALCEHKSFQMDINCRSLIIIMKDTGEIDGASAKVYVDGEFVRDLDPFINRWCHCNPLIIINEEIAKDHHVEIRVDEDEIRNKFTILGFGVSK